MKQQNEYRGSQSHLQWLVNERPTALNEAIRIAAGLAIPDDDFHWLSPLVPDGYREYADREAWAQLQLKPDVTAALTDFWPAGGPVWDGLGRLAAQGANTGLLLEGKSYRAECNSRCRATSPESISRIAESLRWTRKRLGVSDEFASAWSDRYYQTANRLAFNELLNSVGAETWLVNVCFTDDQCWGAGAESEAEWRGFNTELMRTMGLSAWPLRVLHVYLPAEGGCTPRASVEDGHD